MRKPKFFSVSENSLTVSFENRISIETNQKVLSLAEFIEKNPFYGLLEIVPAYSSLTIFYDLLQVRKAFTESPDAFSAVKNFIENALKNLGEHPQQKTREIEIYFDTSDEFALDLNFLSEIKSLSKEKFIKIFTAQTYRVFMLGFIPGFAYMGETDERISVPRKESPRSNVPKGSVGIAGNQTGIYPFDCPGGWQIIGKTETELFTPDKENTTFFQAGDMVKFNAK